MTIQYAQIGTANLVVGTVHVLSERVICAAQVSPRAVSALAIAS